MSGALRDEPAVDDDFRFEEHSGEASNDDSDGGLELDQFQAKEIRQIFLTTLPEYIEPVAQMLDQVLSRAEGYEQVQPAIQTTLASISAAATRIGIHDVCSAIELIRDQLLSLDDESVERATAEQGLRSAFAGLRLLAGGSDTPSAAASSQTIVAAMQNIEGFDKTVLQRLTSAGLVTVDQLRMARPEEIVAVSGLDAAVVRRLLELILAAPAAVGAPAPAAEQLAPTPALTTAQAENARAVLPAEPLAEMPEQLVSAPPHPKPPARRTPPSASPESARLSPRASAATVPQRLEEKLRAQVEIEASADGLRAEILRLRLSIAASNACCAAAQRRHERVQKQLTTLNQGSGQKLARLAAVRAHEARLQRHRSEEQQALDETKSRLAKLQSECQAIDEERRQLSREVSLVVSSITASSRR